MRRAARIDANQNAVVDFLRGAGWSVSITAPLGSGFPDLVCSRDGFTALVEIKDGAKPPSERRLTKDEQEFRDSWQGIYIVAYSPLDARQQLDQAREVCCGC